MTQPVPKEAPPATIDWDPAPAKAKAKVAYGIYSEVVTTVAGIGAKIGTRVIAAKYQSSSMTATIADVVIDTATKKANDAYKSIGDKLIDDAYKTPDSYGSRIVRRYQNK